MKKYQYNYNINIYCGCESGTTFPFLCFLMNTSMSSSQ